MQADAETKCDPRLAMDVRLVRTIARLKAVQSFDCQAVMTQSSKQVPLSITIHYPCRGHFSAAFVMPSRYSRMAKSYLPPLSRVGEDATRITESQGMPCHRGSAHAVC